MVCRMCKSDNLYQFLDLGFTPPADQFRRKDQLREPDTYYPLQVNICDSCGLAQLSYVVSPEVLYRNDYPYESSITETGRVHWDRFAVRVIEGLNLKPDALVVDIGSNVGVLLGAFKDRGMRIHGVDPAANIVLLAQKRRIDTVCDFFNDESVKQIMVQKGQASVITATNSFAHIDDLHVYMKNINDLLNETGVFIFEAPYFVHLLENNEYDTIYHEHLSYLSVKPLVPFFNRFGMEVFDVEQVDIHGGSFRIYVGKKGQRPVSAQVETMITAEAKMGIHSHKVLDAFAERVKQNRRDLVWMLQSLKHEGKKIVAVSAPAKGMTLLNYCRISDELLDFVTEKSTLKIGRYTPGTHIPVVADAELMKVQPDYALILAWNFAPEIMKNLNEFRRRGGKFILPIPVPKIVD